MALALAVVMAACGGKVVVDVGTGGTTTSSGDGGGIGGASCFNPPDPDSLSFCGGSGGPGQCENDFCDAKGNVWAASCKSKTCQCLFNNSVVCTCALNGDGDFCLGTPHCCPLPTL
ncbi:hypothetical protein A7982_12765 [Minicystis rosea]|nr:hypothetical protein A7982_12765 [Minicystis rosea]